MDKEVSNGWGTTKGAWVVFVSVCRLALEVVAVAEVVDLTVEVVASLSLLFCRRWRWRLGYRRCINGESGGGRVSTTRSDGPSHAGTKSWSSNGTAAASGGLEVGECGVDRSTTIASVSWANAAPSSEVHVAINAKSESSARRE